MRPDDREVSWLGGHGSMLRSGTTQACLLTPCQGKGQRARAIDTQNIQSLRRALSLMRWELPLGAATMQKYTQRRWLQPDLRSGLSEAQKGTVGQATAGLETKLRKLE